MTFDEDMQGDEDDDDEEEEVDLSEAEPNHSQQQQQQTESFSIPEARPMLMRIVHEHSTLPRFCYSKTNQGGGDDNDPLV